jgi:hypothetical protein
MNKDSIFARLSDPANFPKTKRAGSSLNSPVRDLSQITRGNMKGSTMKMGKHKQSIPTEATPKPQRKSDGSIFSRLSDPANFTGIHARKYKTKGTPEAPKGVKDLSQITRAHLNV